MQPNSGNLLILPDPIAERSDSDFYIPDSAREKPQSGTIIKIGDNCTEKSTIEGAKIMFAKYIGTLIKIEDVEYIVLRERDVLIYL